MTLEASRRSTLAAHAARREAYLKARDDERERRKREALRRIAPGFEPSSIPLVPVKRDTTHTSTTDGPSSPPTHERSRSVMDDLVDQLAALDSSSHS